MAQTTPKATGATPSGESATDKPVESAPQAAEPVHGEIAEISEKMLGAQQEAAAAVVRAIEQASISLRSADPSTDAVKANVSEIVNAVAEEANAVVRTAQRVAQDAVTRAVQSSAPAADAE